MLTFYRDYIADNYWPQSKSKKPDSLVSGTAIMTMYRKMEDKETGGGAKPKIESEGVAPVKKESSTAPRVKTETNGAATGIKADPLTKTEVKAEVKSEAKGTDDDHEDGEIKEEVKVA